MGALVDKHLKVFHIETALNNRMFAGADRVPDEERGRLHRGRPAEVRGDALDAVEAAGARPGASCFTRIPAPYELIAVLRRQDRAGAREDPASSCFEQYAVPVRGQADILICRHPVHLALQRELDPEPAARAGDGARLLLQHVPRQAAAARRAACMILTPPVLRRVRPRAPPELHRVLPPPAARDARRDDAARTSTRRSSRRTRATSRCTGAATPTTAPTRSSCGTGARTAASTSAR